MQPNERLQLGHETFTRKRLFAGGFLTNNALSAFTEIGVFVNEERSFLKLALDRRISLSDPEQQLLKDTCYSPNFYFHMSSFSRNILSTREFPIISAAFSRHC